MVPRWTTFYGTRTAQGKLCVTCRNGPFVATGDFKDNIAEALADASDKFEREFAFLVDETTDLSELLSD